MPALDSDATQPSTGTGPLSRSRCGQVWTTWLLLVVALASAALMFSFEVAKQFLFPHATIWQSHFATIGFISILSGLAAYVLGKQVQASNAGLGLREQAQRTKLHSSLVGVVFASAALMFAFEAAKQLLLPHISIWQSHTFTIFFTSLLAVLASYFFGEKVLALNAELEADSAERKRMEEALRTSEQKYKTSANDWKATFDAMDDCIWLLDREGTIQRCNRSMSRLLNLRTDEILGRKCYELMHGADSFNEGCAYGKTVQTGRTESTELALGDKWYTFTTSPYFSDSGEIAGAVETLHDITERKRTEEALKESEQRFRALIEDAPVSIGMARRGIQFYGNPMFLRTFGFQNVEGIVGHPIIDNIAPQCRQEVEERIRNRAQGLIPKTDEYETIGFRKDGTEFPMHVAVTHVQLADGPAVIGFLTDITKRKRVEEDLRQSEQRFRALAAATFEGIAITEGGRMTDVNEQLVNILGYERRELIGREIASLLLPEERELVLTNIRQGVESQIEHRVLRKDGVRVDVEAHGKTITYQNRPVRFTAIRDITQRKRAEEALQQSEERFRKAFRSSPLPMAISKIDGGVVDINDILLQKFGMKLEEVVGRTPDELGISMEPASKIREEFRDGNFKLQERETQYRTRSGKVLTFLVSAELIQVGGEPHVLWMARDITEQKKDEDFMRMLGSAVANAADAILIVDADLSPTPTIVYANPAFTHLTGYTPEELVGQRTSVVLRTAPKTIEEINHVLLAGKEYHGEIINHAKDGRLLYLEMDIAPVRDRTGRVTHYVSVRRDISRRKKEELDRKQLLRLVLETQTEERRRISRELHDQAGQLLTSMLLRLTALQEAISDQSVKEAVQEISSTASSTLEDISRIARGLHPAVLDDLGLIEALRRAMQEFESGGTSATLRTRGIKRRLPPHMEYEVYQIIKEALTNVCKYSQANSVVLSVEEQASSIIAVIKDDGAGFDQFEPATGRPRLGIVGMNERAALLGGTVLIDSAPGKGTVVTLTVPLLEPQAEGDVNERF